VNLKYYYWFFKSAIPAEVCDQILEMGLTTLHDIKEQYGENALSGSTGGWKEKREGQDGIPVNHKTIEGLRKSGASLNNTYVRDSHVAFINHPSLYELVWPFVKEANAKAGWNWDWDYTEDFQFTKYSPGQFYGWHTDSGIEEYQAFDPMLHPYHKNPDGTMLIDQTGNPMPEDQHMTVNQKMVGKIRKLSVTISLNDHKDYKGGNLRFDLGPHRPDRYHTCKEIGSKGSVVVFPSFVHHQVTPVTSGTRYSLVAWNLGAPYK
jgi:PKHD-type hydroxylase